MARALLASVALGYMLSALASDWPPRIAPVWPTRFKAMVHGAAPASNITAESGIWWYDWPRDVYRASWHWRGTL